MGPIKDQYTQYNRHDNDSGRNRYTPDIYPVLHLNHLVQYLSLIHI